MKDHVVERFEAFLGRHWDLLVVVADFHFETVLLEEECRHVSFQGNVDRLLQDRAMSPEDSTVWGVMYINAVH